MTASHPPAHPASFELMDDSAAKAHELGLLNTLLESLATATASADSLRILTQRKGVGSTAMRIPNSPCPSLSSISGSNTFGNLDGTSSQSSEVRITMPAASLEVNPKGPHDKFVPGEISLDGRRQVMYNGFIYDIPYNDPTGEVYLVTRGRRVGIFASCTSATPHTNKCSGAVCVKVASLDEANVQMMDAIDSEDARWLK